MKLSHDEVLHIAELAKLGLSEDEVERFAEQLSAILDYAEMLTQLDTDAISPTAQALRLCNVARPDVVGPSLTPDEALANAPEREGGYFRVQSILD